MATPFKGLKFIEFSANFENDPRFISVVLLQKRRGNENKCAIISILVCLHAWAGRSECGYYVQYSNNMLCVLSDKTSVPIKDVEEIIEDALTAGFFDKEIYDRDHVITGDIFQESFFSCLKKMRHVYNTPLLYLTPKTRDYLYPTAKDDAKKENRSCAKMGKNCAENADICTESADFCTEYADSSAEKNSSEQNGKERERGITRECPHPLNISETPIEGKDNKFQVVPDLSWIPEEKLQCLEDEVKRELKVLLSMEGWCVKRRASIDEAVMKVRRYFSENPYLAIEVLSDTIQAAATHIFPPSDTNRKDAMNRLISLKDGQSVKKTPMILSYDEIEGSECGRLWNLIIGMAPEEIADDMRKASFVDTGTKTKLAVVASKKVEEWYKNPLVVERICQGTGPSVGGPSGGLTIVFNS